MNIHLEEIFKTRTFTDSKNEVIPIHSETDRNQCLYLQKLISGKKSVKSIEIGFAYGMSTLAISEAVDKNGGSHVVIDKFENSHWQGIGLKLLERADLSEKVDFHEDFCYLVLPKLIERNEKFDFAYVDSTKLFDWLMVDMFLLDKLLLVGGLLVFDDGMSPSIRKLARFIAKLPHYRVYDSFPQNFAPTAKRKVLNFIRKIPKLSHILKDSIIYSDYELGINAHCIVFEKIAEDGRSWNWDVNF